MEKLDYKVNIKNMKDKRKEKYRYSTRMFNINKKIDRMCNKFVGKPTDHLHSAIHNIYNNTKGYIYSKFIHYVLIPDRNGYFFDKDSYNHNYQKYISVNGIVYKRHLFKRWYKHEEGGLEKLTNVPKSTLRLVNKARKIYNYKTRSVKTLAEVTPNKVKKPKQMTFQQTVDFNYSKHNKVNIYTTNN